MARAALRLIIASGTALTGVLATAPAVGQQSVAQPREQATAEQQTGTAASADTISETPDLVITGSRVVRSGFEAPTPLAVVSKEQLQNSSPTNNIADYLNQLPQLAGSTRPSNSRLNFSVAGINALNLRNLGPIRTLILLDGRRSAASHLTGLVDVNTIPQSLVKSVEITTGGASAAYGSDAVAGVVNFILDKKYTGIKTSADVGITDKGDGFNYSADIAAGFEFGGGRGHILVSGEIAHNDGIFHVDREWNQRGYVRIENPAYNATTNSSVPRFLIRNEVGPTNSTPGSIILSSSGGAANRLRGIYFGEGGSVNRFQYGALTFPSPTGSSAPTHTQGGDWRINDSGRRIGLAAEDDRHGIYGRLSYEVAENVEVWAEAAYNRQHVLFNTGPNLSSTSTANVANIGKGASGASTLAPDNAFLIQALGAQQLTGITAVAIGTTAFDLPYRESENKRSLQRYAIGANGTFDAFSRNAVWDIHGQFSQAELREQLNNIMHTQRMASAVDAVFARAGNPGGYEAGTIVCRINVDANAANDDRACKPLNRLGIGVADPAAIGYVLGNPYRDQTYRQWNVGANLSLTPFATWAGDVSVAVGAEWRKEEITGSVPPEFQAISGPNGNVGVWSVGNYLPTEGSFEVKEAYLETVVPLGFGLEFNGAVRATDYSTSGYVTTWKAGATWAPVEDFRLRFTRSRDIRAPNLAELYAAGSSSTSSAGNPFHGVGSGIGPGTGAYGPSISYLSTAVGNPDLKPEKADSLTIGGVLTPRFLPGFSFAADYFRIDLRDAIDTLSEQSIINRCFEGRAEYCAIITPDPSSASRVLILNRPFNFARRLARGIDFDASYRMQLDRVFTNTKGSFTLRGAATRYIENAVDTGVPGTLVVNTVGSNGSGSSTPTWIFRASAAIDTPSFSLTGTARGVSSGVYASSAIECQSNCPVSTTQVPTYDDNHVKGTLYVDLNYTQKFQSWGGKQGEFFVNVTNAFDKSPLMLPETGLAANTTYSDMLGRTFRVGFRLRTR